MYLHLRVDVHFGTRTQHRLLHTPSRYPLSIFAYDLRQYRGRMHICQQETDQLQS
ncbi:unnamed protein product [Schistosoma mattheei]|uniref:Uncharacterized protein n=1 Tax=Schistosoma mattheei TaxID=31246 RepID=A0A183PMU3_9TREM|nr:unnamed protein product [Schistosoma mattheei]